MSENCNDISQKCWLLFIVCVQILVCKNYVVARLDVED